MCTHTHMLLTYRTSSFPDCSSVELDTIVTVLYPRKYHSIFSLVTLEDTLGFLSFLLSLSCPHFKRKQNKRRLNHTDLRNRKCKIQEPCLMLSDKLDWLLKLSWEQGKCHRRGRSMVEWVETSLSPWVRLQEGVHGDWDETSPSADLNSYESGRVQPFLHSLLRWRLL